MCQNNSKGADDMERNSIMKRFHDGLDSARNLVGVLKSERWRLSKREMSLDLRMGELEEYKCHLKTDMVSIYWHLNIYIYIYIIVTIDDDYCFCYVYCCF